MENYFSLKIATQKEFLCLEWDHSTRLLNFKGFHVHNSNIIVPHLTKIFILDLWVYMHIFLHISNI